ncbi:peritrophin-44 isoform X3 [Eurytemora carolleeae]|uniref:peritrophin-44 isoform X3 n=1 Tax=Eurytemora carolleeae TaxID=1294199 RepID=UPI000C7684A5|nr:peritrophin-44 isoform X3 [Eurytemora carolleeae]|eukprot:XP_023346714.1 peritrophin-44-like isoform X3 [Eurytemora affinis]
MNVIRREEINMATLRICFSVLLLVLGVFGQEECESTFPDGTDCSVDSTHVMEDLEDCSSFWKCSNDDCPKKTKCERNYLFNTQTKTCTSNTMVDCGERPCLDPMHCPSEHPTTTPTPETTTNTCDHSFDCVAAGDGWFADEFNCRKYWHCFGGVGDHSICPQGQLFDPVHVWCDWADRVECGDRPICGVCDDDCETTTSHKPTTWGPTTTQSSCKHVYSGVPVSMCILFRGSCKHVYSGVPVSI